MKKENMDNTKLKESLKNLQIYLPKDRFAIDKEEAIAVSTGSLLLDEAIGIGGYPQGKIIEFFGVDSSGKTTLALHALAEFQKLGKTAVYIDLENTINLSWAKKIGVDVDNFYIARPNNGNGEEVFELIKKILLLSKVDLIIVDSVANIVPSCEFESHMQDQQMGLHARLMSKGMRIIQNLTIGKNTTLIFINQIREKIGGNAFIPLFTTTGGRALKYAASVRIEVKKAEKISDSSGNILGFETRCTIVKNKFGAPMTTAKTAIYFDTGFDRDHEIIVKLIEKQILKKKGSWLEMDGQNLAQGLLQLRAKMKTDEELREKLKNLAFGEELSSS